MKWVGSAVSVAAANRVRIRRKRLEYALVKDEASWYGWDGWTNDLRLWAWR